MSVGKIRCYGFYIRTSDLDYEYKKILRKLKEYGMISTGDKQVDRTMLIKKETEKIKDSDSIDPNILTVSVEEQMRIIEKQKENSNNEKDSRYQCTNFEGQKILGEQLYQAILMKKF